MKEYFSDIVYECNWKTGKSIEISCLLEHKSFAPQNIYIQLNRYLTEGYQIQSLDKAKKKLTLILPIIIYHGQQKWQVRNFSEYFDLPDERLKQFIPNYAYELVDLNKVPDDWMLKLSVGHYLKSTFLVFKHKDDKDFLYQFQEEIFIFVDKELDKSQKRLFVHSLLTYIFAAFKFEPSEVQWFVKVLEKNFKLAKFNFLAKNHK